MSEGRATHDEQDDPAPSPSCASSAPNDAAAEGASAAHVVVVSGRSGAGRTTAINALEDFGYERIDAPPIAFVPAIVEDILGGGAHRVAIGLDPRAAAQDPDAVAALPERVRAAAKANGRNAARSTILFLDGDDDALRRRYTETRRRHPAAPSGALEDGLRIDRQRAKPLREIADVVIDTSNLAPAELKRAVRDRVTDRATPGLTISVLSFSYRFGLPAEADMVFDCRFLRNPHYEPHLRARDGRDRDVAAFVMQDPLYEPYLDHIGAMAQLLLPAFAVEGKSYVTFAFGCTGGKHRSVALAEAFARHLGGLGWRPRIKHRERAAPAASGGADSAALSADAAPAPETGA